MNCPNDGTDQDTNDYEYLQDAYLDNFETDDKDAEYLDYLDNDAQSSKNG